MPTLIEALTKLTDVHLAVVCVPHCRTRRIQQMRERAVELGVAGRLHLLDPVAPSQVAAYLATADLGTAPFLHFGSHEFALPNKLFEYLHAGLPFVVSDCRAQAEFVTEKGMGAVFPAADVVACAAAIRDVLDRRQALHERIVGDDTLLEPFSWRRQAASLRGLYRDLLGGESSVGSPRSETLLQDVHEEPAWRDGPPVVGIGPANFAGQGWAWAKALERGVEGLRTRVIKVDRGDVVTFGADDIVDLETFRRDRSWGELLERDAMAEWTHALLEAGRPLFGVRNGKDFEGDLRRLVARGVRVGLIMHGSEIRDPRRHATTTPWSPFTDPGDELTASLQSQRDVLIVKVQAYADQGVPVFVSTPDLLPDVTGSVWLPVVVDTRRWVPGPAVMNGRLPVVVHAPSRAAMKGSAQVDEIVQRLHEGGVVEYRRLRGVPPEQMPEIIADADILLDQFALGSYGVLACEGMAAGRLVLGHVTREVRRSARDAAGVELPVVEATPDTIEDVLMELARERDAARVRAAAGREFVEALHDGRRSAGVLVQALHLPG
ncbi:glycosyltransferase [Piscicoccus intestinalis]|uniref:glycosyltransferase n=1 Tax=Piscicoccus intestinalis TaxID=746033 RepID=UPI000A7FF233|nr:glycosyltransferase [Piscicoccus intestinalis]